MSAQSQLERLELAGLVRRSEAAPELAYLFRHGLIQDAAYSTLLRQQRRAWHLAAGEALEAAQSQTSEDLAPELARHFAIAGESARAARYFAQAGDAAFDRYALAEAADYYAGGLALATAEPPTVDPALTRHLAARLGLSLELRGHLEDALRHYETMLHLARRRADPELELAALMEPAKIYATANRTYNPERSRALLEKAAPLAERTGQGAARARLLWTLMLQNLLRGGDPAERLDYGERALALARSLGLREELAFILQDLWFAYAGLLNWDRSAAALEEARRLWVELDHPVGQCEVLGRQSLNAIMLGDFDQSLALADDAFQIAGRIHSPDMLALAHAFVSLVHAERGDYARAIELSTMAVATGAPTDNVTVMGGTQAELGWFYGELGDSTRGLALAEAAHSFSVAKLPLLASWSAAVRVRLHLLRGEVNQAALLAAQLPPYQALLSQAGFMGTMWTHAALAEAELALAQGQAARTASLMAAVAGQLRSARMRFRLPGVLHLRGLALLAQGRLALARSELQAARLEAIALDSRRMQWRLCAALAEVEARSGQPEAAESWRQQARALVEAIAQRTPPALRESFRAQAGL